jgi:hypothetical protein
MLSFEDPTQDTWPTPDTRPGACGWILDAPNMRKQFGPDVDQYTKDVLKFRSMRRRQAFIRQSYSEFYKSNNLREMVIMPPLWILVCALAPGWHLKSPFWRGLQPYAVEPGTDAEVMAIVEDCRNRGGYDLPALRCWREEKAKMQSGLPTWSPPTT